MNFEITSLAETMSATEFAIELDNRGIWWAFEECDNVLDYNEGDCLMRVEDMFYCFTDGQLMDVNVMSE